MPPSAALSPGIPSSGTWSYMPPKQSGFHPSVAHAGSSGLMGDSGAAGMRGAAEATDVMFARTAPSMNPPAIAATAALVSAFRASEAIIQLICRSLRLGLKRVGLMFAVAEPLSPCSQLRTCCGGKYELRWQKLQRRLMFDVHVKNVWANHYERSAIPDSGYAPEGVREVGRIRLWVPAYSLAGNEYASIWSDDGLRQAVPSHFRLRRSGACRSVLVRRPGIRRPAATTGVRRMGGFRSNAAP